MVCRSHHPRRPLARVVLDQVMPDLVHQTIEQYKVAEGLLGPVDSCPTKPFLDRCSGPSQALDGGFGKTPYIPGWLQLLVKNDLARHKESGDRQAYVRASGDRPQFHGTEAVHGERTEKIKGAPDVRGPQRMEIASPRRNDHDGDPMCRSCVQAELVSTFKSKLRPKALEAAASDLLQSAAPLGRCHAPLRPNVRRIGAKAAGHFVKLDAESAQSQTRPPAVPLRDCGVNRRGRKLRVAPDAGGG